MMFIRLTKFDNRPVWLNAAFIVTVEPRKDGVGSIVVPIGDGLDYDVRESAEEVLKMLEGCAEPKIVPVPASDALTKTPADVSENPFRPETERQPPKPAPAPLHRDAAEGGEKTSPAAPVEKPAERPVAKSPRKSSRAKASSAAKKTKAVRKPVLELSDEDVARLRKLAPKSIAKLKNTLATQFMVGDIDGTVEALTEKGVITLDGNHVGWRCDII